MSLDEYSPLLLTSFESSDTSDQTRKGLSVFFAVICIVDVFGVFPIIALPRAVLQCGWLGIPLVGFVFFIQMCTAILLGKCWILAEYLDKSMVAKSRYPYTALAEMTFGKHFSRFVTILLDVTIFGGTIPNIIVAAQNLEILGLKMSDDNFYFSHCYWMILLGIVLCPLLWLGSPKDMKIICCISVVAVFSISVMIWLCIHNDTLAKYVPPEVTMEQSLFVNIITAYGIIAFQFDVHPVLLTIQVDMENKTKIPCAVFFGFLITTLLFTVTTTFAAFKYGVNTYANVLQGLPPSLILYLTVLLVTMQLCLTCAVCNSALFQHIEDYLNISRDFNYKRCLLRSSLTALAVFVAESIPKFDLMMSLIGGTLTGPLVFIFPPLFYIKMMYLKRKHMSNISLQTANHYMYHCQTNFMDSNICNDQCKTIYRNHREKNISKNNIYLENNTCDWFIFKLSFAIFVITFGIFATCTTTYISFKDAIKYISFSPPCLYNLTSFSNAINQ